MAVTLSAGGAFRWFRDMLGTSTTASLLSYDHLSAMAASVPIGAEGLIFLPYLSGERTPHLDPLARGAFVGLTVRHSVAHMARLMEEPEPNFRYALAVLCALTLSKRPPRRLRGVGA